MAEEDEIDILGDFTFNSCFAQNSQGIPSCSDREDTVHPQWLLDSTATNWYDSRKKEGPLRKLSGTSLSNVCKTESRTIWSKTERELLISEMNKYGRNVKKISEILKTKTEAEIQALIEAEFGVYLDIPAVEIVKEEIHDDIPPVGQEEIISDETQQQDATQTVRIVSPIKRLPPKLLKQKKLSSKSKNSLLKPELFTSAEKKELIAINPAEILYEDDLVIGSTESVGFEPDDGTQTIIKAKDKAKVGRKLGNHKRKVSRSDKKPRGKDMLKSPPGRQRKNSSVSDDSAKSPKLQIVLGSGQALPISEGEQVIKIEKKDPDSDSDIDIDTNSDIEENGDKKDLPTKTPKPVQTNNAMKTSAMEEPVAVPLRKFEPMPKRQKKFNLDGDGGYTIMHTSAGDLFALGSEPRRERPQKKPPIELIPCRFYSQEKPAPCKVFMHVSTLILMDAHAHTSRAEVMGLAGGSVTHLVDTSVTSVTSGATPGVTSAVTVTAYRPARAAAGHTHCDMDPVSQSQAAQSLHSLGVSVVGWHHSHPSFPAAPSRLDLASQGALQRALDSELAPFLGVVTSQQWTGNGRDASHYRCIRVEPGSPPAGYQLRVKLVADLTAHTLLGFLRELRDLLRPTSSNSDQYTVDMCRDHCPQAGRTYLEKCISSISHHMRSAGYEDDDILFKQLIQGVRDVFR